MLLAFRASLSEIWAGLPCAKVLPCQQSCLPQQPWCPWIVKCTSLEFCPESTTWIKVKKEASLHVCELHWGWGESYVHTELWASENGNVNASETQKYKSMPFGQFLDNYIHPRSWSPNQAIKILSFLLGFVLQKGLPVSCGWFSDCEVLGLCCIYRYIRIKWEVFKKRNNSYGVQCFQILHIVLLVEAYIWKMSTDLQL